jgi:hypothetical protein
MQLLNVFPAQRIILYVRRIHRWHPRLRRQLLGCYYQVIKVSMRFALSPRGRWPASPTDRLRATPHIVV